MKWTENRQGAFRGMSGPDMYTITRSGIGSAWVLMHYPNKQTSRASRCGHGHHIGRLMRQGEAIARWHKSMLASGATRDA